MNFHLFVVPERISLLRGMGGYLVITGLLMFYGEK